MRKKSKDIIDRQFPPAKSIEERENQMISLAVDRAELQLRDGTASSQVICHYLKLGSTKERLEREIMEEHKELLQAKTEMINSAKRVEEIYTKALHAMRAYSGNESESQEDDYNE
jgi:hypothetical protein